MICHFMLSSYFYVTINKLWCLLFVCGYLGGRRGGGWEDFSEGWYLGCEVWIFLQEMWKMALCKKGKELQRHGFSVHIIEVLEFCIILSTLSQYAHNFTVYPDFFFYSSMPCWVKSITACNMSSIMSQWRKYLFCTIKLTCNNQTSSFSIVSAAFVWDC